MTPFDATRIAPVEERIAAACARAGRDREDVQLIAVTKTRPLAICEDAAGAGLHHLAENYVHEWLPKSEASEAWSPSVHWHFIGRLQSNKVGRLIGRTHRIHTVDRPKLLDTIDRLSAERGVRTDVLLQVNVAGEEQKGGCPPDEVMALATHALALPCVRLRGLMTIAPMTATAEEARPMFRALRNLLERVQTKLDAPEVRELSMGMTADLEVAVEEGATWIRIGTALFGPRS